MERSLAEIFGSVGALRATLLCFTFVLYFAELGDEPLATTDTALHGGIARRMAQHGPWLTPELYGQPWFEHTPLFLWMTAACIRWFGFSAASARLPGVLLALAAVIATFELARLLRGPAAGLVAGFALATTELFFRHAARVRMDVPLTAFVTAAVLCLALARRGRPRMWLGFGLFTGLAVFVKGPMGLAPLAALAVALVLSRDTRALRSGWLWAGLLLVPAVPAPWVAYQLASKSGWYERYVVHQVYTLPVHGDGGEREPLFVLGFLLKTYWPWLPLVGLAVWQAVRRPREALLPLAEVFGWAAFVGLGLSVSARHPDYYLLPIYPALAVLVGSAAAPWVERRRARVALGVLGAAAALAVVLAVTPLSLRGSSLERESGAYRAIAPEVASRLAGRRLGVFGLHENRSIWGLTLYLDLVEEPVRLDSPQALASFLERPDRLVVMPAGPVSTASVDGRSPTKIAEAGGLMLLSSKAGKPDRIDGRAPPEKSPVE